MKIEIKSVFGAVLFEGDFSSVAEAVKAAILSRANLSGANLSRADLSGANLYGANLSREKADTIYQTHTILPEGDLIGYKKLAGGVIAKLKIPADAKRVGGLVGRKCRAEFAIVLEGSGKSRHDNQFVYEVGATVRPTEKFDDDVREECRPGIHFFITRAEAEAY